MDSPHRVVLHEHRFEEEFAALEPDPERREEIISGIEWALSRNPERGAFTEGQGVWIRELCDPTAQKRFWIFYTFNDTTVILLSITAVEAWEIWPE